MYPNKLKNRNILLMFVRYNKLGNRSFQGNQPVGLYRMEIFRQSNY